VAAQAAQYITPSVGGIGDPRFNDCNSSPYLYVGEARSDVALTYFVHHTGSTWNAVLGRFVCGGVNMKSDWICDCGRRKKAGTAVCSGCKSESKALEKGKMDRVLKFAAGRFFYEFSDPANIQTGLVVAYKAK